MDEKFAKSSYSSTPPLLLSEKRLEPLHLCCGLAVCCTEKENASDDEDAVSTTATAARQKLNTEFPRDSFAMVCNDLLDLCIACACNSGSGSGGG